MINFLIHGDKTTVVPIAKDEKDGTNPDNYCTIALTCLGKTMERMISNRLTWFLESNRIKTSIQSGFRA